MPTERFTFAGSLGHDLAARLELPESGDAPHAAVFAHCFTCSKDVSAAVRVSRALAARGIAVLRFDFTGLGQSEGAFEDTHFSSNVDDLVAATDALRARGHAPRLLVGHSLGGAAVLRAAHRVEGVRAVATIGAPAHPGHVEHQVSNAVASIEACGEALVELAGRPFTIRRTFLDDIREHAKVRPFDAASLIFHAPEDDVVSVAEARTIYDALSHPKSFVSLSGADHLLSDRRDADYVGEVLAAWGTRYLAAG